MTAYMIRVVLPFHLQTLAKVGSEVTVEVSDRATYDCVIEALEQAYPMLCGTIRDHVTKKRRPLLRYFVCSKDVSHEPSDSPLPQAVLNGTAPFIIWGAIAGG